MSLLFNLSAASPTVHSICAKVILSLLLNLPQIPPKSLSPDSTAHGRLFDKVRMLCTQLGCGSEGVFNQALSLIINSGEDHRSQVRLFCTYFERSIILIIAIELPGPAVAPARPALPPILAPVGIHHTDKC